MKRVGAVFVITVIVLGALWAIAQQQRAGEQDSPEAVLYEGKTLREWVEVLQRDDADSHVRAARTLVGVGEPAYAALSAALSNPYKPIWKHTVAALVTIGEPAVPVLLAAIYMEQSGDLRHNGGIAALQQMGDTAHPALVRALGSDDETVRLAAITALRTQVLGPASDAATRILTEVLRSHRDVEIRMHAAEAIGYSGLTSPVPPDAVSALTRALGDLDADVRGMAAVSLVSLDAWRGSEVVPLLIDALKSNREMLPYFAIEALGQLGPVAEQAIPSLLKALEHDDPFIADDAAEAVGKIGGPAIPALL